MGLTMKCPNRVVDLIVNGVGIPGFPVDDGIGTAPPILLMGGTFQFGKDPPFIDDPPPGLAKADKLIKCTVAGKFGDLGFTIDPAWMMFPGA